MKGPSIGESHVFISLDIKHTALVNVLKKNQSSQPVILSNLVNPSYDGYPKAQRTKGRFHQKVYTSQVANCENEQDLDKQYKLDFQA